MKTPDGFDITYIFLAYVQPYDDLAPKPIKTEVSKSSMVR